MKKKSSVEKTPIGMSNAIAPDLQRKRQKYRQKRKLKAALLVSVSAIVLLAAAVFIFGFMRSSVIPEITLEAGDEAVTASDFFEGNVRAFFVGDSDIDTSKPGAYSLTVRNGILFYHVKLNVEDTVAPSAKVKHLRIRQGKKTVSAMDFLKNVKDETEVTATFEKPIDYNSPGDSDVSVILTDLGGNETRYDTKITIFPEELNPSASVEAGYANLSVKDFLADGAQSYEGDCILTELPEGLTNKVGTTKIEIMYCSTVYTVSLEVEDTVPPGCSVKNVTLFKGESAEPEEFINTIRDNTKVNVTFVTPPDFNKVGQTVVELQLEDGGRNTSIYKAILTVKADTTPPSITALNRTVYIGDNIRFSEGVKAYDECDGELEVEIDKGSFDKDTPGEYIVKFTATDKSGNTATKNVIFIVKKKPYYLYTHDVMDQLFYSTYSKIITTSMTDKEKMRAIYDYIRENISFNGTSEKSDWEQEAYRGLRSKEGDSFTFYAISRKLLTMAGIENKEVTRINSESFHYWNMVQYEGKWYHFDTCPHYKDFPIDSFMLTDEEAAEYSKKTGGYYTYK